MTDKEIIKAEIERLMTRCGTWAGDEALEEVLSFLDTHEAEENNAFCKENCKGYQDTGRCFCDGGCEAKKKSKEKEVDLEEHNWQGFGGATIDECITYLEKLKEQKPAEWSEEDEDTYNRVYCLFRDAIDEWYKAIFMGCYPKITKDKVLAMLKNLHHQPKQEWSEKDKTMALTLMRDIEQVPFISKEGKNERIGWLNNLPDNIKPQSNWKPSEEQLDALKEASVSWMNEKMGNAKILESLYEQLKAL